MQRWIKLFESIKIFIYIILAWQSPHIWCCWKENNLHLRKLFNWFGTAVQMKKKNTKMGRLKVWKVETEQRPLSWFSSVWLIEYFLMFEFVQVNYTLDWMKSMSLNEWTDDRNDFYFFEFLMFLRRCQSCFFTWQQVRLRQLIRSSVSFIQTVMFSV